MEDIINYVKEWNLETSKTGLDNLLDSREQEGRYEEKLTIAKNMLNRNMSIEDIIAFTGLSKEEILSL